MIAWRALSPAEKADAVAPLAADGLTSAQIALALGAPSRDAVIGVCWRNGIKLMWKPVNEASGAEQRAYAAQRRWRPLRANTPRSEVKAANRELKPVRLPTLRRSEVARRRPAPMRGIEITAAPRDACRFPLWAEGDDHRRVCGAAAAAGSWCEHHRQRVFRSAYASEEALLQ